MRPFTNTALFVDEKQNKAILSAARPSGPTERKRQNREEDHDKNP